MSQVVADLAVTHEGRFAGLSECFDSQAFSALRMARFAMSAFCEHDLRWLNCQFDEIRRRLATGAWSLSTGMFLQAFDGHLADGPVRTGRPTS